MSFENKEIKDSITKDNEIKADKPNIDYEPSNKVFTDIKDFQLLKQDYENLKYEFLSLKNTLKNVEPKKEQEQEKTKEQIELENWTI